MATCTFQTTCFLFLHPFFSSKKAHLSGPFCFSFSTFSFVMLDSRSHKEFTVCLLCLCDDIPQMDLCGGNGRLLWGRVQCRSRPLTAAPLCLLEVFFFHSLVGAHGNYLQSSQQCLAIKRFQMFYHNICTVSRTMNN